jgi:hypothetical protein
MFASDKRSSIEKRTKTAVVAISVSESVATMGHGCKNSLLPLLSSFPA